MRAHRGPIDATQNPLKHIVAASRAHVVASDFTPKKWALSRLLGGASCAHRCNPKPVETHSGRIVGASGRIVLPKVGQTIIMQIAITDL